MFFYIFWFWFIRVVYCSWVFLPAIFGSFKWNAGMRLHKVLHCYYLLIATEPIFIAKKQIQTGRADGAREKVTVWYDMANIYVAMHGADLRSNVPISIDIHSEALLGSFLWLSAMEDFSMLSCYCRSSFSAWLLMGSFTNHYAGV